MSDRLHESGGASTERAGKQTLSDAPMHYSERQHRPADRTGAFVIQKHWASDLHYDLRLELDGKMKSWAISKGPSLDPNVRRIAVHTADHPLSSSTFEGFVRSGHGAAGEVILWDRGEWSPLQDARKGLNDGYIAFRLEGDKLQGTWELLRLHAGPKDDENWVLIKQDDEFARSLSQYDVLDAQPDSVNTTRAAKKERPIRRTSQQSASLATARSEDITTPARVRQYSSKAARRFPHAPAATDIASYYTAVRDVMIEHLLYRPVTLHHSAAPGKRNAAAKPVHSDPDALLNFATARAQSGELAIHHTEHPDALDAGNEILMAINTAATLEHVIELDAIEFHTRNLRWRDQLQPLDQPDRMIFALNASAGSDASALCDVAMTLHAVLEQLGLAAFVKTDGQQGLHIDVPIHPEFGWATVYSFSRAIVDMVARQSDIAVCAHMPLARQRSRNRARSKASDHASRVYIECLHNEAGQTTLCAWSLCRAGAADNDNPAVSVPLDWNELRFASSVPQWGLDTIGERLHIGNRPWQAYQRSAHALGRAMQRAGFEV